MQFVFGPVHSRRLGLSLGIEIVPAKYCTYNCLYCEAGKTTKLTADIRPYVAVERVVHEVEKRLFAEPKPEWLTFSGAGEPTLHERIGDIIDELKRISSLPICVLTNGSLFHIQKVRERLYNADVVMPSLDTAREETFTKLYQPHPSITLKNTLEGLRAFSREYRGQLWLEVVLVENVNDTEEEVDAINAVLQDIRFDRLYVGTVTRPPAFDVTPLAHEKLKQLKERFRHDGKLF